MKKKRKALEEYRGSRHGGATKAWRKKTRVSQQWHRGASTVRHQ